MCYVQYMPVDGTSGSGPETSSIVRGCIDERTPLLCENRRPQAYTGSWPVLLCCKEEWCNKDVLPTVPPWLTSFESKFVIYTQSAFINSLRNERGWGVEITDQ